MTAAADRVGVKQQQWDKWENQAVIPSDRHRGGIADVLRIDRAEFAGWIIDAVEQRDADKTQELVAARRDIAQLTKALEMAIDELRAATAVVYDLTAQRRHR